MHGAAAATAGGWICPWTSAAWPAHVCDPLREQQAVGKLSAGPSVQASALSRRALLCCKMRPCSCTQRRTSFTQVTQTHRARALHRASQSASSIRTKRSSSSAPCETTRRARALAARAALAPLHLCTAARREGDLAACAHPPGAASALATRRGDRIQSVSDAGTARRAHQLALLAHRLHPPCQHLYMWRTLRAPARRTQRAGNHKPASLRLGYSAPRSLRRGVQ